MNLEVRPAAAWWINQRTMLAANRLDVRHTPIRSGIGAHPVEAAAHQNASDFAWRTPGSDAICLS